MAVRLTIVCHIMAAKEDPAWLHCYWCFKNLSSLMEQLVLLATFQQVVLLPTSLSKLSQDSTV